MDSGKNDFEVTIKEALHIKFKKPTINRVIQPRIFICFKCILI